MISNLKRISFVLLLCAFLSPLTTLAAGTTPNVSDFGYGVRVDLHGVDPYTAIQEAGKYKFDWVAFEFNWNTLQSDPKDSPNWQVFDTAMELSSENHLAVLISITHAPAWAMDQNGPNVEKTMQLISELVRRYPEGIFAIELFPFANTVQGWGTMPDPIAYTYLIKSTSQVIRSLSPKILIVGAGLTPVKSSSEGMDDLDFLRQIYSQGIDDYIPLIGLRLMPKGSDPLARNHFENGFTLRRYEEIRKIMNENGHKNGLIWITGFSWDTDSIGRPGDQAVWLKQAYQLLRSQLYIGAAFFDSLNPSPTKATRLLGQGGTHHPGFEELIKIIAQDHNGQTIVISIELSKKLTSKPYLKAVK